MGHELDVHFKSLLDDLNVPEDQRQNLINMPDEQKVTLIKQHRSNLRTDAVNTPELWAHKLRTPLPDVHLLRTLLIVLRAEPVTWMSRFVELDGVGLLTHILQNIEITRE